MTSYCIYLYSDKFKSYDAAGVYGNERDAMLVAQALKDLVEQHMITFIYNNTSEPFDCVEIRKYSDTNTITTGEFIKV